MSLPRVTQSLIKGQDAVLSRDSIKNGNLAWQLFCKEQPHLLLLIDAIEEKVKIIGPVTPNECMELIRKSIAVVYKLMHTQDEVNDLP